MAGTVSIVWEFGLVGVQWLTGGLLDRFRHLPARLPVTRYV